ncbi:hypothetical protein HKX48_001503 [Thoreauomyces humboldtii]|nr:hypothetical protein HKX48_001503 [Thoreauomyces humboldtii]
MVATTSSSLPGPPLSSPIAETWLLPTPTSVLHFPSSLPTPRLVIVLVPGNPGVPDYYTSYLTSLYAHLSGKCTIIAAGHLGHDASVKTSKVFRIREQVDHKVAVLDEVERRWRGVKVVLMGHSFGAWCIVQVMKARPKANVVKIVMLFPTLHHIADSPQGKIVSYASLPYIRLVAPTLVALIRLTTPAPLLRRLIHLFSPSQSPTDITSTLSKLLRFNTVHNTLALAYDEMRTIRVLERRDVEPWVERATFYYGTEDRWVPVEHAAEMKNEFPDADVRVCVEKIGHAFVMGWADNVAEKTAGWIREVL